jgi:hypothetical protein
MRTHDYMGNLASAADEKADLPVGFTGEFRELPGQFLGKDTFRRDPAPVELLDSPDLVRAKARGVAVDSADGFLLSSEGRCRFVASLRDV